MDVDGCSDQQWGFLATDVPDAPACISDCRDKFLKALVPADETFGRVCEHLSENGDASTRDEAFQALYCCDAQLCGVDNLKSGGEDRTLFPWTCLG